MGSGVIVCLGGHVEGMGRKPLWGSGQCLLARSRQPQTLLFRFCRSALRCALWPGFFLFLFCLVLPVLLACPPGAPRGACGGCMQHLFEAGYNRCLLGVGYDVIGVQRAGMGLGTGRKRINQESRSHGSQVPQNLSAPVLAYCRRLAGAAEAGGAVPRSAGRRRLQQHRSRRSR